MHAASLEQSAPRRLLMTQCASLETSFCGFPVATHAAVLSTNQVVSEESQLHIRSA